MDMTLASKGINQIIDKRLKKNNFCRILQFNLFYGYLWNAEVCYMGYIVRQNHKREANVTKEQHILNNI